MSTKVGVGIIGSRFIAEIHAESLRQVEQANLLAVASPNLEHARDFAARHHLPHCYTDYRPLLEMEEIQIVSLCLPNALHCEAALAAAEAGKHIICEKPLCLNLREADLMIDACRRANVKLMYAEELCFAPKYVRAKQLVDEGALGDVYFVKQSEKHFGPHSGWFWDVTQSGGGVLQDMGCHGIEFARWILDRPPVTSVYAHCGRYVHRDLTQGEDNALIIVEFGDQAFALIEESWSRHGGMDDRAEIHGTKGATYADLLHGNALETYSEVGYGYAVEKAAITKGWTFTIFEEIWNYGFPQEMRHFIECVLTDTPPAVTGEDGRAVLEIIIAAYESAATGRKVALPSDSDPNMPIQPWLDAQHESKD
jgi:predicted dehydrogenase